MRKLAPMDLPKDYLKRAGGADSMQVQIKLQNALVKLSAMPSGFVQNRDKKGTAEQFRGPSPENFQKWYDQEGQVLMAELGGLFGDKSVPTRLKRIPGTNSYEKAPRPV
jgi:antitoxin component of MazEF toxin-antitoxin module